MRQEQRQIVEAAFCAAALARRFVAAYKTACRRACASRRRVPASRLRHHRRYVGEREVIVRNEAAAGRGSQCVAVAAWW